MTEGLDGSTARGWYCACAEGTGPICVQVLVPAKACMANTSTDVQRTRNIFTLQTKLERGALSHLELFVFACGLRRRNDTQLWDREKPTHWTVNTPTNPV